MKKFTHNIDFTQRYECIYKFFYILTLMLYIDLNLYIILISDT